MNSLRITVMLALTAIASASFVLSEEKAGKGSLLIIRQEAPEERQDGARIIQRPAVRPDAGRRHGTDKSRPGKADEQEKEPSDTIFDQVYPGVPFADVYPYGYPNSGEQYPVIPNSPANSYRVGYSEGYGSGNIDRINGYLYNPRQYEKSGDPDYFEGFVAGYRDGFRR